MLKVIIIMHSFRLGYAHVDLCSCTHVETDANTNQPYCFEY